MPSQELAEIDEQEDIPRFAMRCWQEYQDATEESLIEERESAGMWVGGKLQWREGEYESRTSKNRPCLTINRCGPIVSQVENEARENPPGPQAYPVGGGADGDGADILEGLIREYEFRSDAQTAYITGLRTASARMRGAFELATEFVSERSMEQQLVVKEVQNPEMLFFDPRAVKPCREDGMWQGKVFMLTREELEAQHGSNLKVLDRSMGSRFGGWLADVAGFKNYATTLSRWAGGPKGEGPYYLCEFWRVVLKRTRLVLGTDHLLYFIGEKMPRNVKIKTDPETGNEVERWVPVRKIKKYLLTALDVIEETDWPGDIIPIFWILGPEMWINGKCHRLSLLSGAMDAQRGLNYTVTSMAEILGSMTKSPWVGYLGQFDAANAQGINPWENSNGQLWNYLETIPTFATDPDGHHTLLPPPQRNTWEAPIARAMEAATFFIEQIKGAASVFFEPSLPSAQKAQSGAAIRALQAQTNIGTLNWQDALHRAVSLSYNQAAKILPQLYDAQRVRTIIRADNSHEITEINKEFPDHSEHEVTGKISEARRRNNITLGQYAVRVTAAGNFKTQREKTVSNLLDIFKIVPQLLTAPAIAAQFLRMMGEGDPRIEQMADLIDPSGKIDMSNPQQVQAMLSKMQAENQQLKQGIGQLQQAIAAKLPDIEARKWIAALNALTGIRKAEIAASKDADSGTANQDALTLEQLVGMAHDTAMQASDQAHERNMQAGQQQAAAQAQQADQAHAQQTQQSDQQAALQQQQQAQEADQDSEDEEE